MKKVFVMFIFAVMIGSLVSVSAQLGQTGTTTIPPKYTINDCVKLENGLAQSISDVTMGLAQKPSDAAVALLGGFSGTLGAFGMISSVVMFGMGMAALPVAIPVMIIGGGLVYYSYRVLRTESDAVGTAFSEDECYSSVALSTSNPHLCTKVTSKTTQNSCYFNVAIKTNNFVLCDSIDKYYSHPLYDVCYYKAAMQAKNVSLCEKLSPGANLQENPLHIICVENLAKKV